MERVAKKLTNIVTSTASKGIKFETSNLAKFADGACTCSIGNTSVLVTAVSVAPQKLSANFVPLTVDYKHKAAAAGRIPLTHLRRDIGITEAEILTSRMIDRSVRSSFQPGFCNDTQIICNILAADGNNNPDVLAINGASASLALSDIPWTGPVGSTRVGLINDTVVANPTRKELENSRLNLVMTANKLGNIVMLDGSCKEPLLMPDIIKAMKFGASECRTIVETITRLQNAYGKPKRETVLHVPTSEQLDYMKQLTHDKLTEILSDYKLDKIARGKATSLVYEEALPLAREKFPDVESSLFQSAFASVVKGAYKELLFTTRTRCDGRLLSEIRPITCKVDLYKPLHGSALFQRGQTQVFCSTTYDSPDAAFRTDSMTSIISGVKEKNFMLHYEFPPYATNEIGRVGTMPGRREIGHGALAEKAIRPLVPEDLNMTVRLNCEVLESNGSSSMASVCAGSMSLMDAGVKISEHVAGVAMGLISQTDTPNDDALILTDISGFEDYFGEMDLKIAGTKKAVTAIQLDAKPADGLQSTIIYKAIQKAHIARGEIINTMSKVIKSARSEKKDNHPVMKKIHVPQHRVAALVGFGGSNLKKLMATTGVRVSAFGDDGNLNELGAENRDNFIMFAPNKEALQEAEECIKALIETKREPQLDFNAIYTATIQELRSNGVMVTLYPNMTPALLPLSQLDIKSVQHPSALNLEVGQQIQVKYFGRDPATGQMRLSRKSLMMSSVVRVARSPCGDP